MTLTDILTPVLLGLAFYGYVQCLARYFWITLVLSAALVAVILQVSPFAPEQALNWLGAAVVVVLAVLCAWLWPMQNAAPKPRKKPASDQREIAIDGTNVLYWNDNEPSLDSLRAVIAHLAGKGFLPFVFLDASSRHHLRDTSLDEAGFARALSLHPARVMVCPAGTEADVFLLKFARDQKLAVVSNDRFGDRKDLARGTKLVKGVIANGKPILDGL